jgi:hypothetical protein
VIHGIYQELNEYKSYLAEKLVFFGIMTGQTRALSDTELSIWWSA